jgi:hypothetical protein
MTAHTADPAANKELEELLNTIRNEAHLPQEAAHRILLVTQEKDANPAYALITQDLNHIRILSWWHDRLYAAICGTGHWQTKLMKILDLRENISAIHVTAASPAYRRNPPVKTYLLAVLDEAFRLAVIRHIAVTETPAVSKLAVTIPVAELALLLKLLNQQGVFRTGSVREVLRFAAANFSSKRQNGFSFKNISKEYYGANQVTAARIRSLLSKMIDSLNRDFFPILLGATLLNGTL